MWWAYKQKGRALPRGRGKIFRASGRSLPTASRLTPIAGLRSGSAEAGLPEIRRHRFVRRGGKGL